MTLVNIPLDSVTEAALQGLVYNQVSELRVIEYKSELPGGTDDHKKEFLSDVCSFANVSGGDLVYGIMEEAGLPEALVGVNLSDADAEIRKLENLIRDGIEPRIPGVSSRAISLTNGNSVLVIRVPRSFAKPHVVNFKRRWRFYTRSSAGKYPMNVGEVRSAFVLSESIAERIRSFRADRLSLITADQGPAPISDSAKTCVALQRVRFARDLQPRPGEKRYHPAQADLFGSWGALQLRRALSSC
jgi:hypothetical protein